MMKVIRYHNDDATAAGFVPRYALPNIYRVGKRLTVEWVWRGTYHCWQHVPRREAT